MNRSLFRIPSFALLVLAAGLTASAVWARTLEIVEYTAELRMSNVTFPSSVAGTVIFRGCATCEPHSMRVTGQTQYFGYEGQLTLGDFLLAVADIRQTDTGDDTTGVGVTYTVDTQSVTRISMHRNTFRSAEGAD